MIAFAVDLAGTRPLDSYEFQVLHGIRPEEQKEPPDPGGGSGSAVLAR